MELSPYRPWTPGIQPATTEIPGQDNFGNPIDAPVLRHLENYKPASTNKLGKHENAVLKIIERNGPMLVGDLRKEFQASIKQGNPGASYNTLKISWQRAYRTLKEKEAIIEESNTISLVQGVQGVQKGHMYPNVPGTDGVHRVHTPKGVYPCTPVPVPESVPISGNQIDDSQAAQLMESASSSVTDNLSAGLSPITSGTRQGTRQGTRHHVPQDQTNDGPNSSDAPDPGPGYMDSLVNSPPPPAADEGWLDFDKALEVRS